MYDAEQNVVIAKLPFVDIKEIKLSDNYATAKKILEGQIRQAHRRQGAVEQIEKSHNKLRDRGFVRRLDELPETVRVQVDQPGYFIPWRTVQSDSF